MMVDKQLVVESRDFGSVSGQGIMLFYLSNGVMDVEISNYGATIVSINVPSRSGKKANVVAGFSNVAQYAGDHPYIGCTIGRYAGRIAFGKFRIGEKEYSLPVNDGLNHLHGGVNGFHKKVWNVETSSGGVTFSFKSEDWEEGYPGELRVSVNFYLSKKNELIIRYTAITDKETILNLTNHSYFNLSGFEEPTIYGHALRVLANGYTVKNKNNIPTGEIRPVLNTPYNFLQPERIAGDIDAIDGDMGYDINYVLNDTTTQTALAAELYEPISGRLLKLFTDRPGLQVYTANLWDGSLMGSQGKVYRKHGAIALETQAFPDSPNHSNFPNTILKAGAVYRSETIFQFLTV